MSERPVCRTYRLGLLEMRVARHHHGYASTRQLTQGSAKAEELRLDPRGGTHAEEAHPGRTLVVA